MKKSYLYMIAAAIFILCFTAENTQAKVWIVLDSVHRVSGTQIQYCYHTDLDAGDSSTNLVFLVTDSTHAQTVYVHTEEPVTSGLTYRTPVVSGLDPKKHYAMCVYGTALIDTTETIPWQPDMTVTIPAIEFDKTIVTDVGQGISIVTVFPNPNKGTIVIQNFQHENANYELFDAVGNKVAQIKATGQQTHVSLDLPKGNYFLSAGGATQQIIIQ